MSTAAPSRAYEDEYLTQDQLQTLAGLIQEQIDGILVRSRKAVGELTEVRQLEPELLDIAVSESHREYTLRMAERERTLLNKLKLCRVRMEEGVYGTCERCGGSIGYGRLLARPVATQCIDCKTEAEHLDRHKRR